MSRCRSVGRDLADREKLRFDPLTRASHADVEKGKEKHEKNMSVIEVFVAGNATYREGVGRRRGRVAIEMGKLEG